MTRETSVPTPPVDDDGAVARSAAIGAAVGFVVTAVLVGGLSIATGIETGSAIGLGAFIGAWGGAGFGFMMGGTTAIGRPHPDRVPSTHHHHTIGGSS